MKQWEVECTDKETGLDRLKIIQANTEKEAAKQAQAQGLIVRGVYEKSEFEDIAKQKTTADTSNSNTSACSQDTGLKTLHIVGAILIALGLASAILAIFWETSFDIDETSSTQILNYVRLLKFQLFLGILSGPLLISGVCTCSMATLGKSMQRTLATK